MLTRAGYITRELWYSLKRNPSLFFGTLITVAVSLTLLGFGLLVLNSVSQATERWQGDIEFIVFMNPDATELQDTAIQDLLDANPAEINRWEYFDQAKAFEEFQELFKESPELIESISQDVLPPSYRVVPVNVDPDVVAGLAEQFQAKPGVKRVVLATEVLRQLEELSSKITAVLWFCAGVLLLAAVLLVFNTIRTAIFARRREIEVMRLVGASNWYIRFPFLVEGTGQGLLGGLCSIPALLLLNTRFADFAGGDDPEEAAFTLLNAFVIDSVRVWEIGLVMGLTGAAIGAFASMIAITRFLDV